MFPTIRSKISLAFILVLLVLLTACASEEVQDEEKIAEIPTVYTPSNVVQWNELALAAIRQDPSKPTVITRSLFMLHTAMFDAWSVYDDSAESVEMVSGMRRPEAERTAENKEAAVSQAAYHMLVYLYPEFEQKSGAFSQLLAIQGYVPDDTIDTPMAASDVGLMAAEAVINSRNFDGANAANEFPSKPLHSCLSLAGSHSTIGSFVSTIV